MRSNKVQANKQAAERTVERSTLQERERERKAENDERNSILNTHLGKPVSISQIDGIKKRYSAPEYKHPEAVEVVDR